MHKKQNHIDYSNEQFNKNNIVVRVSRLPYAFQLVSLGTLVLTDEHLHVAEDGGVLCIKRDLGVRKLKNLYHYNMFAPQKTMLSSHGMLTPG